jgi:hypothetical protein
MPGVTIDFNTERALASVNQERLGNNPIRLSPDDVAYLFEG